MYIFSFKYQPNLSRFLISLLNLSIETSLRILSPTSFFISYFLGIFSPHSIRLFRPYLKKITHFFCQNPLTNHQKFAAKPIDYILFQSTGGDFFVIVLQCTDSNSQLLSSLSDCHKPMRYCSVFCHNDLPPVMYYTLLRCVTYKTFKKNFGRDFSLPPFYLYI